MPGQYTCTHEKLQQMIDINTLIELSMLNRACGTFDSIHKYTLIKQSFLNFVIYVTGFTKTVLNCTFGNLRNTELKN